MLNLILEFVAIAGLVATAVIAFTTAKEKASKTALLFLAGFGALAISFSLDLGLVTIQNLELVSDAVKLAAVFLFFFGVFELRRTLK